MTFHVSRAKGSILMQASLLKESETAPTLESLIAAVDRLGPTLRARAAEAEGQRQLPAETIRDLFDAGVLRFFIPRRFGGHELEWGGHLALGRRLAHHCASTAWISCVVGSHATYVGRMDPRAQQDVWRSEEHTSELQSLMRISYAVFCLKK